MKSPDLFRRLDTFREQISNTNHQFYVKLANKRRKDVVESFDKAVEASDEAIDALTKAESKGKAFENGTIP